MSTSRRCMRLVSQPFLAGSIKKSAALALNTLIETENQTIRCTLLGQLVSNIVVELSRLVEDLKLVHREAVRAAGVLKSRFRECRELATAQTTTFRSVIKADEFETALAHLDSGIRGANEALPALGVAELMRAGQLGVAEQIEKVVEARTTIYDQYFEATLCDVTGSGQGTEAQLLRGGLAYRDVHESCLLLAASARGLGARRAADDGGRRG